MWDVRSKSLPVPLAPSPSVQPRDRPAVPSPSTHRAEPLTFRPRRRTRDSASRPGLARPPARPRGTGTAETVGHKSKAAAPLGGGLLMIRRALKELRLTKPNRCGIPPPMEPGRVPSYPTTPFSHHTFRELIWIPAVKQTQTLN